MTSKQRASRIKRLEAAHRRVNIRRNKYDAIESKLIKKIRTLENQLRENGAKQSVLTETYNALVYKVAQLRSGL